MYTLVTLEIWVSFASLGLIVMFVILLLSFIMALIGPQSKGPSVVVEPRGAIIQIISISGAPGVILAGITFGLVKDYGSKCAGLILCGTGIVLILGMVTSIKMLPMVPVYYSIGEFLPVWYGFLASAIAIILIGIKLTRVKRRRIPWDDVNF